MRLRERFDAAQGGDSQALEALLREHLDGLRAFVRLRSDGRLRARESASDLVQSVCREVLGGLGGVEYRDEPSFRAWLYTVALNKVREKGRFHTAERRSPDQEAGAFDELGPPRAYAGVLGPSEEAIGHETAERLEAAFDQLSQEQREVVLLARVLRLPHAQIAERMGRSNVAVRSLLSRALVRLSGALGDLD